MSLRMQDLMTAAPHTIGAEVPIEAARRMMTAFGIHHLPVRDEGRLVGVVAAGDLDRAVAYHLVRDVMHRNVVVVAPADEVASVASSMAERRSDAAVVMNGGEVVGIFTSTDAGRALSAALRALDHRR